MLKLEAKHVVKIMLSDNDQCSVCKNDMLKKLISMFPRWERMINQMYREKFGAGLENEDLREEGKEEKKVFGKRD